MSEAEWLASGDPRAMLVYAIGRTHGRKLRLFACSCCVRIWHLLRDERSRRAVEIAELFADGVVDWKECEQARNRAKLAVLNGPGGRRNARAAGAAYSCTDFTPTASAFAASGDAASAGNLKQERAAQTQLLREVFGNPFRPMAFDPAWRTTDVTLLARGIYEEKAFDRMPILADALQDAGCEVADLLDHLRDPKQTHVRGCWALDLVLGKE